MAGIGLIPTLAPLPAGGPSPEMIDLQRKYAAALLNNRQPIAAPSQGIEAILEGIMGARGLRRADAADAAANADAGKASAAMIAALMGPSAPASPGSPAIPKGGMTGWRPGPATPAVPPTPATGINALTPDKVGAFIANPRVDAGIKSAVLTRMMPKGPGDPFTLAPGETRFGPDGKPIATGAPKVAEDPALLREADALFPRGSPEWKKFVTDNAGGAKINLAADPEAAARAAEIAAKGKANVDLYQPMAAEIGQADDMYSSARQLASLIKNVKPGSNAGLANFVRENFGIKLDDTVDDMQAIKSLIGFMAPRMRVAGTGSSSDRDVNLALTIFPSLLGTPEGNKIVGDTLVGMTERWVGRAQIAQDYLADPNMTAKDVLDQMRKLPDPFEAFKKSKYYTPDAAVDPLHVTIVIPKVGTIEDGYEFTGGDPGDLNSWRPVSKGR